MMGCIWLKVRVIQTFITMRPHCPVSSSLPLPSITTNYSSQLCQWLTEHCVPSTTTKHQTSIKSNSKHNCKCLFVHPYVRLSVIFEVKPICILHPSFCDFYAFKLVLITNTTRLRSLVSSSSCLSMWCHLQLDEYSRCIWMNEWIWDLDKRAAGKSVFVSIIFILFSGPSTKLLVPWPLPAWCWAVCCPVCGGS